MRRKVLDGGLLGGGRAQLRHWCKRHVGGVQSDGAEFALFAAASRRFALQQDVTHPPSAELHVLDQGAIGAFLLLRCFVRLSLKALSCKKKTV